MTLKKTKLLTHSIVHSCAMLQSYRPSFVLFVPQEHTSPFQSSCLFTLLSLQSKPLLPLCSLSGFLLLFSHLSSSLQNPFLAILPETAPTPPPLFPTLAILKMHPCTSSMSIAPNYWRRNSEGGPCNLGFNKPFKRFWYALHFENQCSIPLPCFILFRALVIIWICLYLTFFYVSYH